MHKQDFENGPALFLQKDVDLPVEFELIAWFVHITDYSIFFFLVLFLSFSFSFFLPPTWLFSSVNTGAGIKALAQRAMVTELFLLLFNESCICF